MTKRAEVPEGAVQRFQSRVLAHHRLSATAYELVLERGNLDFAAGRLLTLHGRDVTEDRSYTIASGEADPHVHVLYRLVDTGVLTPQLVQLQAGDTIELSGPYGQFVLRDSSVPIFFIATGTGIAPCRAYVRSHPGLDLTVVHGVRTHDDLFFREEFAPYSYQPCLTAEPAAAGFHGRVTDFLTTRTLPTHAHYYLCGAYEMIYDVQDLLLSHNVPAKHIFVEGYYYRLET